jgi:hypothetical protein
VNQGHQDDTVSDKGNVPDVCDKGLKKHTLCIRRFNKLVEHNGDGLFVPYGYMVIVVVIMGVIVIVIVIRSAQNVIDKCIPVASHVRKNETLLCLRGLFVINVLEQNEKVWPS